MLLYSFHLPLFFIISGYLFSYKDDFKEFFIKKTKRYLIPYIYCMLINTLILSLLMKETPFVNVRQFILQIRFPTLWFLLALYGGILLFSEIVSICERYGLILMTCTFISVFFLHIEEYFKVPLPWNFDIALIVQLYFAIGYGIKHYSLLKFWNNFDDWIKIVTIVLLISISIIFTFLNSYLYNEPFMMSYSEYGIIALTIPASCFMSVAILCLASYLKRLSVIEWIGKNSFTFFAFHKPLGIGCMYFLCGLVGINDRYIRAVVAFGGTLIICYIIHIIICKCRLNFIIGK